MKVLIYLLLFSSHTIFALNIPPVIHVCGDAAGWPPYAYNPRDNNGVKSRKVQGYSVDVLKEIFKNFNTKIEFELLPWKRCLEQVKIGKKYFLAPDSSFSKKRAESYIYSDSYYQLTPYLYYYKKSFPQGYPKFSNIREILKIGPLCGLSGYNYKRFMKGIDHSLLDLGTKNYSSLVEKTRLGRCKAFLARQETLTGFTQLGYHFNEKNEFAKIKLNVPKERFYIILSKENRRSVQLVKFINMKLKEMEKTGLLDRLLKKHLKL